MLSFLGCSFVCFVVFCLGEGNNVLKREFRYILVIQCSEFSGEGDPDPPFSFFRTVARHTEAVMAAVAAGLWRSLAAVAVGLGSAVFGLPNLRAFD